MDQPDQPEPSTPNKHAQALAKLGAKKGGEARAASMSESERSDSAKKAAMARWKFPKETHRGTIRIGSIEIPCAVLEGGVRVIPTAGVRGAFGLKSTADFALFQGDSNLPRFLARRPLAPFVSDELRNIFTLLQRYRPKGISGGVTGYAYRAEILPMICEAIADAEAAGKLTEQHAGWVRAAQALHRALARTGIVALIDEATGYQYERPSDDLQRLIELYVVEQMRPWVKLFPNMFFRNVYKIHGWKYDEANGTQTPRYVGKFINKYIYEVLPPVVLEELHKKNPSTSGRRRYKLHSFLTESVGVPALDRHIASVTTLMQVATSKTHFQQMFDEVFRGQARLPDVSPKDEDSDG